SDFSLNGVQVGSRVRAVGSLHRQFTNALQVTIDFVQRTFGRLRDRDTVVGVTSGLRQTLDIGCEAVGNGLAGGVVLGAVDAHTGRQAFDSGTEGRLGFLQIVLRNQSQVVGIDY